MLHPSYTDLMHVVNADVEEGETKIVNSRYSIVLATSKRARQIIDGDDPMVKAKFGEKPLSIAINELQQGELKILAENSEEYQALVEEAEAQAAISQAAREALAAKSEEEAEGEAAETSASEEVVDEEAETTEDEATSEEE